MRRQAKILIGPQALRTLAEEWSRHGLLAETVWVDSELLSVGLSAEKWQAMRGQVLRPGLAATDERLMEYLSTLDDADAVAAVWLRRCDDNTNASLAAVDDFLLQVFTSTVERVRMDVVNPRQIGDTQLPERVQGWQQFLIATQDNPELANTDAGWTQTHEAVALHTVAALAGILGGETRVTTQARNETQFVHVLSRHIGGGRLARRTADHFLDHELPTFDATDVEPLRFGRPLHPQDEVDRCLEWLHSFANGALGYRVPPPEDVSSTFTSRLDVPLAGWGLAIRHLIDGRPVPDIVKLEKAIEDERPDTDKRLRSGRDREGERPTPDMWEGVFRLLTSIVDGGAPPTGFSRSTWVDRELVLPPRYVDPDPSLAPTKHPEEVIAVLPTAQGGAPTPILAAAIGSAEKAISTAPAPFHWEPPVPPGAAMVDAVAELDDTRRAEQAALLAGLREKVVNGPGDGESAVDVSGSTPSPAPERLADRLFHDILRDGIHARMDGARWHRLAVDPWPETAKPPTLLGRALVAAAGVVGVGGDVAFKLFQDSLPAIPTALGYAIPWFAAAVIAAVGIGSVARSICQRLLALRNELIARRALEDRALLAYAEAGRLDHVARIFGRWWTIFALLYRHDPCKALAGEAELPTVPASLQVGEPCIHAGYEPVMIAKAATTLGWRAQLIVDLAARTTAKYRDVDYDAPTVELFHDLGMPSGVLDRLIKDLESHAIWPEWRAAEVERIATAIRDQLVASDTRIDRPDGQTAAEFLGEVRRPSDLTPGIHQMPPGAKVPVRSEIYVTGNAEHFPGLPLRATVRNTWTTGAASIHIGLASVPAVPRPADPGEDGFLSDDLL